MPLLTVHTSAPELPEDKAQAFLRKLSSAVAEILGKPERYMMTCLAPRSSMTFGDSADPACAVEVKSIGALSGDKPKRLTEAVCRLVQEHLRVPKDRVYVVCTDVPASLWGHDGSTFG
jgi:phenylpyruvate tautomerase PptA (4-oxalocrotonate tautomerase family)